MAADATEIANQALVILGASSISDITATAEPNAVIINTVYAETRDALTRLYQPKFATQRVAIVANITAPTFGRARAYDLPALYLALLPPYPEDHLETLDWIIEGSQILSDDSTPLDLRFTAQITDVTKFDPTFVKMLAAALAVECVEKITQSTSKWERANAMFDAALTAARRANSFEQVTPLPPEDGWVHVRHRGTDNTRTWHG